VQHRLLVNYRRFGTTYRSSLQILSSLRRPIGCPERLFSDYQSMLYNIPKDLIHHGGSLNLHIMRLNYALDRMSLYTNP